MNALTMICCLQNRVWFPVKSYYYYLHEKPIYCKTFVTLTTTAELNNNLDNNMKCCTHVQRMS